VNTSATILFSTVILFILCAGRNENEINKKDDNEFIIADSVVQVVLDLALENCSMMIRMLPDEGLLPRSENQSGELRLVKPSDWTSGFFPGILWLIYETTNGENWRSTARKYTACLLNEQYNSGTHDMGFKMFCSFGNGYKLTKDTSYRTILIQSAYTLASRFNPVTGCVKSWDWGTDKWEFPVIIDNMMNLELLLWAYHETKDSLFYQIAVRHADNTIENHFRDDNSSYHVVDYDPRTGQVIKKLTHQGYADSSAWARGQSWGLYGFTMCYRETGLQKYLDMAERIAGFIIHHPHLPEDKVPYWDFDAPDIPDAPRDVSAAAIICSALYELASFSEQKQQLYLEMADGIFHSLCTENYTGLNKQSPFILKHSTGNKPAGEEIDVPVIYADYYFLEALIRRNKFK
jgi:unsaturated chondroitin disaccharide hydrolase